MELGEAVSQAEGPVLAAAAVLGVVLTIAAGVGVYIDGCRRVSRREALLWGIGDLLAQPIAYPLYLWRAYRHPIRVPTPAVVLPWVRAANYAVASGWVAAAAAIPMALVLLGLGRIRPGWGDSLAGLVAVQGLTIAPVLVVWTYAYRALVDRRAPTTLGTPLDGWTMLRDNLGGVLLGVLLTGAAAGIMAAVGALEPRAWNTLAGLASLAGLAVPLYLSAFFEEIVLRGYIQRTLFLHGGHVWAVAGSALCFGLLHAMNPGVSWLAVANIILVGVLLSLVVIRTNSLWVAAGLHFGWNLMLGPVLGLPVSGVSLPSVLRLQSSAELGWLAGGSFGPEASPITSGVLMLAIGIAGAAVARTRRWHEPPDQEAERPLRVTGQWSTDASDAASAP